MTGKYQARLAWMRHQGLRGLATLWAVAMLSTVLGGCLFLCGGPHKFSGGPGMPECYECPSYDEFDCCPPGYAETQAAKRRIAFVGVLIGFGAIPLAFVLTIVFALALFAHVILAQREDRDRQLSTF